MHVEENKPLGKLNTLGLPARARYFAEITSVPEAQQALSFARDKNNSTLILGGGSNLVLQDDFKGLVIRNQIMGKSLVEESAESVLLRVGAGENWHALVDYTLAQGWYGLENLALIPGCVGAAPIQNIGAYGVELCNVFAELQAVELASGALRDFSRANCNFGYRESVFKGELKDQFLITSVTLKLSKIAHPNISYGALRQALNGEVDTVSPKRVRDLVCEIRRAKLPDPNVVGNVGSFFKNPVVSQKQFLKLRQEFEDLVGFADEAKNVKLAAGWLIENCGWKGHREGDVGVHPDQALVLVNYASANPNVEAGVAKQLLALAGQIRESVQQRFGVLLEPEPRIVPEPNW